uniref:Reverse transcriptase domain-containing protein n=1 Tax=Aegilops tauschii subsp. strangulata TaxID=200361 RepID=A0A453PIH1_AEGTS
MSKGRFQNLQMSLTKRLIQWGDGHLAQPGRETLIKSVAQVLPTYIMGVFKVPFSVCDELTRMVRGFYWGAEKGKRKVHWRAWDDLLQPKSKGGAGFRDFRIFNQALLAQQA